MAFRKPTKSPQFADLKGILSQSKEIDNPLYQVVRELIERLTQLNLLTTDQVGELIKDAVAALPAPPPSGSSGPILESDIVDGTILARVASNETITGTWTFTANPVFNPLSIPETAIIDGSLLARNAGTETITGAWTFTDPRVNLNSAAPQLCLLETDAAVDNKLWRFFVNNNIAAIDIVNDANSATQKGLSLTRSGMNITDLVLLTMGVARLSINSSGQLTNSGGSILSAHAGATLSATETAWNPPGFGSNYLHYANCPTTCSVRGILAQTSGFIFSVFNGGGTNIIFFTEDASASPANRITGSAGAPSFTIKPGNVITFMYTAIASRWLVISHQGA